MDRDAVDAGPGEDALQIGHHPCEGGQGVKGRRFGRDPVAGRAEQPATAGSDEARPVRLPGERGQHRVEQATLDSPHVGAEIAGSVNHRIDVGKLSDP